MLQRILYGFVLCVIATSLVFAGVVVGPKAKAPKAVRGDEVLLGVQDGAKAPVTPRVATSGPGDSVWYTYYTYGSNGSVNHNIINFGDGTMAIGRMMATVSAGTADRGTWYSYSTDGGVTWPAFTKVEGARRGWSNIMQFADAGGIEATVSHTGLRYNVHDAKGGTAWTETLTGMTGTGWPKGAIGGGVNVHVFGASAGSGGGADLKYQRSTDGGATFEAERSDIFTLGDSNADGYDIAAKGDYVALVTAASGNDVILNWSTDGGTTFTEIVVYDVKDQVGQLPLDTRENQPDGTCAVIIDGANAPHIVWGNFTAIGDSQNTAALYYSRDNDLMYWTLGSTPVQIAKCIQDTLLDGVAGKFDFDGANITHPDIALDAAGNIYVVYMQVMGEVDDSLLNYAHTFGVAKIGGSWKAPFDITPVTKNDCDYASIADLADNYVYMIYNNNTLAASVTDGSQLDAVRFMRIPVASFNTTDVRPIEGAVPSAYELNQNYPNPFNPTTNISYAVPVRSNVKLVVYDITGREVATLVNGFQEAGSYVADFNAKNLSSGVYFYSLTAGSFSSVKKMVLMK